MKVVAFITQSLFGEGQRTKQSFLNIYTALRRLHVTTVAFDKQ
jgi:hypothetical protein